MRAAKSRVGRPSGFKHRGTIGPMRPGRATGGRAPDEMAPDGAKSAPRLDRAPRAKGKEGGKTNVNVIIAPKPNPAPAPVPMPMPAPAAAAPTPMPPRPPMAPPPGMPMRARGGRVKRADGGEVDTGLNMMARRSWIPDARLQNSAKQNLGQRLRERQDFYESPDVGIEDKDRRQATEDAYASGDYKDGTYSPFRPVRGERAKGGRVGIQAGAYSGPGRLEKARMQKKDGR